MNESKLLVNILLDKKANISEREDALTDLLKYKDSYIEDALLQIINDKDDDKLLRVDSSESLLVYWSRKGLLYL